MGKRILKFFRYGQRGDILVKVLLACVLLAILGILPSVLQGLTQSNLDRALQWWESQGYVAYADPDGTLYVYDIEPNDTCTYDLGSLSKYFRNIYINGELVTTGTVTGDLVPTDNDTYDLGSDTNRWKDLYITDGSIHLGNRTLSDNGTQLKVDDTYISALGTPDYIVGVNTATDDVLGESGYWVKSGSTGQIVSSTASPADDDIQWAIDQGPGIITVSSGNYTISTTIVNKLNRILYLSEGAVLLPSSNTDVIQMSLGSILIGGTIDILHSSISTSFTSDAIVIDGQGVATANLFQAKTIIRDTILLGYISDTEGIDRGKGLHLEALNGEGLGFVYVNNVKIEYFKEGLYLTTSGTGWINNNTLQVFLAHQYYPIYINQAGSTIGMNNVYAQVQPASFSQMVLNIQGAPNSNEFHLDVADGTLLVTDYVIGAYGGTNNTFWVNCDKSKIYYDAGTNQVWHLSQSQEWAREITPAAMMDDYIIAIPFRDSDGAIASDVVGRYLGSHSARLYNSPTWGVGTTSACPKLNFNGTTQYGLMLNNFLLNGDRALTFIFAPAFNSTDNASHVIAEWYRAASEMIQISKTSANNLEVYWSWYLPDSSSATASAAVAFSAGDILVITVIKNETADLLQLYVNGVQKASVAATGQVSGNSGPMYFSADHTPTNFAGGDWYFIGLQRGIPVSDNETLLHARDLGYLVGLDIP